VATVFLTGTRPMVRPNSPRPSRHTLIVETDRRVRFAARRAVERAWPPLAGLSWPHPRSARYDLIHSFNAIPITEKPWVTTFESVLPRTLGPGGTAVGDLLRERLLGDSCRGLLAMSQYARGKFVKRNEGWSGLSTVLPKVSVLYPHFDAQGGAVRRLAPGASLRLVFVGNDFARKGGIAALRAVARASAAGLPVHLDVVSALRLAGSVYTDHPDRARYAPDLRLLTHPAVTMHGRQPNVRVLALMADAHLQLLPTMDDTFGYGVVEGFSVGTPALATNVCAMPELVTPDTGALVDLPHDRWGNWTDLPARREPGFWATLDSAYDALADQIVERLTALVETPRLLEHWSEGALARFARVHESSVVSGRLDAMYDAAVHGEVVLAEPGAQTPADPPAPAAVTRGAPSRPRAYAR
jgi:glycosyltransferase involved in cell wall biosynthesis